MPELNLNRFDALADMDNLDSAVTPTHSSSKLSIQDIDASGSKAPLSLCRQSPKQHASLLVHDSSNQKACSVRVPPGSLKSASSLVSFLEKKGLTVPESALFTLHEDRVPCQLHVVKPTSKASLLTKVTGSADIILHLFNAHNDPSKCVLHEFANVHPDCYKTLSECAEQPLVEVEGAPAAVDFQRYLEAAFEASISTDSILYNDCDKVDMKAEWCTWNTGLVWKNIASSASVGYIYLFFKRSLSRVGKAKLPGFPLLASRQAKPWTMNKPKVISDVEQWLNGAPAPPPPPADLVAKILAAQMQGGSHAGCDLVSGPSALLPQFDAVQDVPQACSPVPSDMLTDVEGWRKLGPVATATKADKGKSSRRKRNRRRSNSTPRSTNTSRSEGSTGSSSPGTPTKQDLEFFGKERFNSLVAILNQACNAQSRSCGWISSLSVNQPADTVSNRGLSAEWWAARTDWGV